MATLAQFLNALNSDESETREAASRVLLREFRKTGSNIKTEMTEEGIVFLCKRLNDENEIVRRTIAQFLFEYAKSGNDLGAGWVYLTRFVRSKDNFVRRLILESYSYLDQAETKLKDYLIHLNDPRAKFYVAEALTHYYSRKKYFSSLIELLKKEAIIARAAIYGIKYEKLLGSIPASDYLKLEKNITFAESKIMGPGAKPKVPVREAPKRDKYTPLRA